MIITQFSLLCPSTGAALATLGETCQSLGEIQKVAFQRIWKGVTKNNFSINDAKTKANWDSAIAKTDSEKITISSLLYGEEKITPGEAREDDATLGGIAEIIGSTPTEFSAQIKKQHQKWIEKMKPYMGDNIGVYLFDEHGQIGCLVDDQDNPTTYYPIPIKGLFIGDLATGNYNSLQSNAIQWKFLPNWSDKFVTFKPSDFNPVHDLANANS